MVRFNQRQKHEKLASGKSFPLSLDCDYYLVPSSWLLIWRNYINASGRNVASAERPETLDGVIDSLKCEKVIWINYINAFFNSYCSNLMIVDRLFWSTSCPILFKACKEHWFEISFIDTY